MPRDIKQRYVIDTTDANRKMRDSRRHLREWRDDVGTASKSLTGMIGTVRSLATVITTVFVSGALVRGIGSLVQFGDQLEKVSQQLGVTVNELAQLQFVAERSGLTFEQFQTGFAQIQKNLLDFTRGTGEARQTFEALGLTVEDANRFLQDPINGFIDLADRMKELDASGRLVAESQRIAGESGRRLVPVFRQGGEAIRELAERQQFLTGDLELFAQRSAGVTDAMTDLSTAWRGLVVNILTPFLPLMQQATTSMAEFNAELREGTVETTAHQLERMFAALEKVQGVASSEHGTVFDQLGFSSFPQLIARIVVELTHFEALMTAAADATLNLANAFAHGDFGAFDQVAENFQRRVDTITERTKEAREELNKPPEQISTAPGPLGPPPPTPRTDQEQLQIRIERLTLQAEEARLNGRLQLVRQLLLEANEAKGELELLKLREQEAKAGREPSVEQQLNRLRKIELGAAKIREASNEEISKSALDAVQKQEALRKAELTARLDTEFSRRQAEANKRKAERDEVERLRKTRLERERLADEAAQRRAIQAPVQSAQERLEEVRSLNRISAIRDQGFSPQFQERGRRQRDILEAQAERELVDAQLAQARARVDLVTQAIADARAKEATSITKQTVESQQALIALEDQLGEFQAEVRSLEQAFQEADVRVEGFNNTLENLRTQQAMQEIRNLGSIINNTAEQMVIGLLRGTQTMEELWRNFLLNTLINIFSRFFQRMVDQIFQQIAESAAGQAIGSAIGSAFSGAATQSGGLISRVRLSGPLKRLQGGGFVGGFGFGDRVPALLEPGEFVVSRRGVEALDRLNRGATGQGQQSGQAPMQVRVELHNLQRIDPSAFRTPPSEMVKVFINDVEQGGATRATIKSIR